MTETQPLNSGDSRSVVARQVHLAAALTAPDLRAVIAYDNRLADAVATQAISVASPT